MPGILLHHREGLLPVIECAITFPKSRWTGLGPPKGRFVEALVDTGATHVVAPASVIAALGLPPVGTKTQNVVGNVTTTRPAHLCDVIFVGQRFLKPHINYIYTVPDVEVVDDTFGGGDIILGWNALDTLDLSFGRNGTVAIHLP